ncbi:MAG: 1-acyl-sn-glycerol-3-phosphate acyltransferase [Lachnospiraceae bacterium]|nr:1-acyl-sn-glycerol-3-phosphate acyltransferase [Lachnospiraceae bacterium]
MKIKVKDASYEEVMAKKRPLPQKPVRQSTLLRTLMKTLSASELKKVHFTHTETDMEDVRHTPCLVLMNHSSFIDLEIAATLLYPDPFHIICTSDGFVGKYKLMRDLGCIPTQKFVTDSRLVKDMLYALKTLKSSVLMYPEASYSFDGCATPLPRSLGKCIKVLKVPVVMIHTYGAFAYDPLYNCLQKRNVDVSATMRCLLKPEETERMSADEINHVLAEAFRFDNFRWQQENHIRIEESFRADGLNRVLYKCAACGTEGETEGKGTAIRCRHCGAEWELTEEGALKKTADGNAQGSGRELTHIPDWYRWERECVREELQNGTYRLDVPVDIIMMVDYEAVYRVGEGRLTHGREGFHLTGCDGKLDHEQSPLASYSLYADYYWYELGDMICIGTKDVLYYCFPKTDRDIVAKTRLAAEELYKLSKDVKSAFI